MLTTHDCNLQIAKQTARGVYPAAPAYFLELIEGGLVSSPTVDSLNIMDGRIFGASRKRIGYVETGGQPTVTAQPKGMGAVLAWMFGSDTPAGGADPYTHTIVPAAALSGFPFFTAWQKGVNGQWSVFHDLQIIGGDIEVAVDSKFMRLKPNIVGMAKEQYCAAPGAPATQETDAVHWLDAGGYHCGFTGDWTNLAHIAVPTDLDTLKTALASFKTVYNAHLAVATGLHHKAADAVNTLAYATPLADLAACIVALTEIRADLISHEALTTTHYFADTTDNNPSASWIEPCVTLADCLLAAQDLLGAVNTPGCYNRHLGAVANLRNVKLSFSMNASPIQGEGVTAYTVHRKPGTIGIAVDQLQEDMRLINRAKYGKPVPVAGDEITTEIQNLGFKTKFTASVTGNERSIAISVPQFDLDPSPLMGLMGNPEGNEPIVTVGGEASGTAPICTVTVVNDVSAY
jgi:hypothetical protein